MTTLAGRKLRRYREAHAPKLTRAILGQRFGVPFSTVEGWEEAGKVPRAHTLARVVASGIVDHADWFKPAECPRCEAATDEVRDCSRDACPLAMFWRTAA